MKTTAHNQSYVFQVELLVEGPNNGVALEQLLHALNQLPLKDYRITGGIQLGQLIDQRKQEAADVSPIPVQVKPKAASKKTSAPTPKEAVPQSDPSASGFEAIRGYMKNNKLIRLLVNKGFGVKLSIPCRIINFDEDTNVVAVYHVDEKQVYTFRLNEIEDFQE
ncbi:hypothetical protein [Paenibacillus sp. NPDC058071]|uniref:hypothetical protein n=1 Tax=Paenibacillus sp. NPDC058071 TaxID=3346326 RepID=UPI0036DBE9D8